MVLISLKSKKLEIPNAGEDMKYEPFFIAGGNAKRYNHIGR